MRAIQRARMEAGMTRRQLAEAVGVSVPAVSKWEREGTARAQLALMARVARALGVPMEDLLDESEERE